MELDGPFAALADPTRRALLTRLEGGERTVSDLASPLPMTLMAIQKHIKVLEDAGLVETRKLGRSRYVRLRAQGLRPVTDWAQRAYARWNSAFDKLEKALEEDDP